MPSATSDSNDQVQENIRGGNVQARTRCLKPLKYTGTLDKFQHQDLTPVIGREYIGLQVTELLAENNEQLIKDLAVTGRLYSLLDPLKY
jgi:hypothetical protein